MQQFRRQIARSFSHTYGVISGAKPTKGQLLLATPPLADPNFDRTVVFMLEHNEDGAIGVVLNRPSEEPLGDELRPWIDLQIAPATVYTGGPVEPAGLVALALTREQIPAGFEGLSPVLGRIISVDLEIDPTLIAAEIDGVRVFRGYAGWAPGQLENELQSGAWLLVEALPTDPFDPRPTELWRNVLRRQVGRLAWLATAPNDLDTN